MNARSLTEPVDSPPGPGVRQPAGGLAGTQPSESGGGPPQSRTLPRPPKPIPIREPARKGGGLRYSLAAAADDADLRRLLRENPMPGRISLSLEREPDYFADAHLPGETKQTIVVREGGRVISAGSCVVRRRFVNGEPQRVGYLGGLRLDHRHAGRFDILRRGYEFFHELQTGDPAAFYFTSIAADNERARKFLERGLPGMPRYEFVGEFVTCLLPAAKVELFRRAAALKSRTKAAEDAAVQNLAEIQSPSHFAEASWTAASPAAFTQAGWVAFLNECNQRYRFAPCWSAAELATLESLGLHPRDFCFAHRNGGMAGIAALWDQRAFKQTVVRGYAPWPGRARRVLNLLAPFTGAPRLPAMGETIAHAFVSHLGVAPDDAESLIALVEELRRRAAQRGIELLTAGFDAHDPHLAAWRRRFRAREYRSRLYVVRWPDLGGSATELGAGWLAPEVALL